MNESPERAEIGGKRKMDMTTITQYFVPQIVAFCLCVGYIMKRWLPMDNKWIPTVLFCTIKV